MPDETTETAGTTGTPGTTPAPLAGLRVLECGDTIGSAYAGRLLADLGADVVLVESEAGHPLRYVGPWVAGVPGSERSAAFAYFHAGKRSAAADRGAAADLAARADVLVRASADGRDLIDDATLARIEAANPGLIVADLSTFGRIGRPGPHPSCDLLALAAGGLLSVNATRPCDPAATPLRYRGELSSVHAGASAVLGVLGALAVRDRDGVAQRIDVSAQAAVAAILTTAVPGYSYAGVVATHDGLRGVAPWGFYACRDGHVLLQVTEEEQWRQLLAVIGNPEWGDLDVFATIALRSEAGDALDALLGEAIARFSVDEFLDACRARGVGAARIHRAEDILAWEQLRVRDSFGAVGAGDASVTVPVPSWRYRNGGEVPRGRAPGQGEHTAEVAASWGAGAADPTPGHRPAIRVEEGAPLAGVRVIDLTWVWAGPYAVMQLAHLGADVIKVESSTRVDITRRLGPFVGDDTSIDGAGYFNQYNQGKRGVALDLKHPGAQDVLRRLLAGADVVVDNMRAGALGRMGFGYDVLSALNPRIVAVSLTGFGETGPEADRVAYGSLIDALSGVASANGPVGGGPTDFVMSLPDPCAGIHAAIATLAALRRARRTGRGERVECSMVEASIGAFPWPVLYEATEGRPPPVLGNRDERMAPHDTYRCRGTYEWVAVAVADDAQFACLAGVLGRPELAAHPRFATAEARRLHADELDAVISAWAAERDAHAAAGELRAGGVPAERVAHIDDLFAPGPLRERGFFVELDHPVVGRRALAGPAWVAARSPMLVTRPAPVLGQHTREVLRDVLGMAAADIDALDAAGALR